LLVKQTHELVVLLDRLERLDEDGLTGRGRAVHDARDFALELGAYGDDETVAADGDDSVLCAAFSTQSVHSPAQTLFYRAVLLLHGAANAAQLGRGIIGERAVGLD